MDELGFTLAGFAVLGVLHYAVAIVFAVSEYRKWRPTGWIIPLAVVMFVAFSFIFPVVEHIVRPQNAGLRRRPAYHPAETRAGVVRAAFNECRY